MIGRLVTSFLIAVALFSLCHPAGLASAANQKAASDDKSIEITADRLEALEANNVVIFSGSAVATQGERTIKADKILLYYKKERQEPTREDLQHIGKIGDLERIEAQGHVIITQGDRTVRGNKAVYYQETQKIVMTGDAMLKQGSNVVRGDKVQVFLDENRGVVEATENKRVKATIFPTEKKTTP